MVAGGTQDILHLVSGVDARLKPVVHAAPEPDIHRVSYMKYAECQNITRICY